MTDPSDWNPPAELLAALRGRRGDCPELEELLEPERLDAEARERLEGHLELCPSCAAVVRCEEEPVDDPSWRGVEARLDARQRPWSSEPARGGRLGSRPGRAPIWIAAAAVLALLAGVAGWRLSQSGVGLPPSSGVVRGANLQALAPVGAVAAVEAFRWRQASPLELRYEVEVERGGARLWTGETDESTLVVPAELTDRLTAGKSYRWRVVGYDRSGEAVARSAWIDFRVE